MGKCKVCMITQRDNEGPFTNNCKGGWLVQRGSPLKIFDPCKGALKKNTTNFPVKIELTCFFMVLALKVVRLAKLKFRFPL